eukprot:6202176-Pleurochrysis_carterae.AAC.1
MRIAGLTVIVGKNQKQDTGAGRSSGTGARMVLTRALGSTSYPVSARSCMRTGEAYERAVRNMRRRAAGTDAAAYKRSSAGRHDFMRSMGEQQASHRHVHVAERAF